jgi:hypothetical protein
MEEGNTRHVQLNLIGLSLLAGAEDFSNMNAMADSKQVRNFRSVGVHSLCKTEIIAPCVFLQRAKSTLAVRHSRSGPG